MTIDLTPNEVKIVKCALLVLEAKRYDRKGDYKKVRDIRSKFPSELEIAAELRRQDLLETTPRG